MNETTSPNFFVLYKAPLLVSPHITIHYHSRHYFAIPNKSHTQYAPPNQRTQQLNQTSIHINRLWQTPRPQPTSPAPAAPTQPPQPSQQRAVRPRHPIASRRRLARCLCPLPSPPRSRCPRGPPAATVPPSISSSSSNIARRVAEPRTFSSRASRPRSARAIRTRSPVGRASTSSGLRRASSARCGTVGCVATNDRPSTDRNRYDVHSHITKTKHVSDAMRVGIH